jgi:hypothetical protein
VCREILVKRDQLKKLWKSKKKYFKTLVIFRARKVTKDTLLEYETNYFSDIHCAVDKY